MAAKPILDRLSRVKVMARGVWSAQCPAHTDPGQSLTIRQLRSGRAVVHCSCHCSPESVLAAINVSPMEVLTTLQRQRWLHRTPPPEVCRRATSDAVIAAAAWAKIADGVRLDIGELWALGDAARRLYLITEWTTDDN